MSEALTLLDLEGKVALLTGTGMWTFRPEPRLGLPAIVCANGPAGVLAAPGRELVGPAAEPTPPLPCPSALGATRDPELVERAGRLLGAQARRAGVHMILAPILDLHGDPLSGRHFECLSADPQLTARLGTALVRGIQSFGVAACVKHFVGNESERDRYTRDAEVGHEELRERWLPPFEAAVRDGGAWAVMAAYNSVNGTPMTEHAELLRGVLKNEWGFDGVVVSDWGAATSTAATANAGLDLVMPGPWGPWGEALVKAVRAGEVAESEIDDKVRRLLRLAGRVTAQRRVPDEEDPVELGRLLATRSFVLLTNRDRALPLDPGRLRRIVLIGEPATRPCLQGGGSSALPAPPATSPARALADALPAGVELQVLDGVPVRTEPQPLPPCRFEVELLDAHGAVVTADVRPGPDVAWPEVPAGAVRAVVRLVPAEAAELAVAGLGHFTVTVGGRVAADTELTADLAELLGGFRPPPHLSVPVPAGAAVEIGHAVTAGGPAACWVGRCPPRADTEARIAEAADAARAADAVIVMVGTTGEQETEGRDRTTLALPGRQDDLVAAVTAAAPRTVVVVNAGAPVRTPWADGAAAVLWTWFGGQEYGTALAEVLLGAAGPGGRLPCDLPGFPIGHGLDYPGDEVRDA